MKKHITKMIAPIIVAIIFTLYFSGIAVLYLLVPNINIWVKLALIIIPVSLGALMIGVTVSRIKEIRKGEEDDLSKY